MNGKCIVELALMALCLVALACPAAAGYATNFAAAGLGFSGFCLDPALGSWGWAMPTCGWGWAWPTF